MKKLYASVHRCMGGNEKTDELKALFAGVCATAPEVRYFPERDPYPADARIKAIRFTGLPYQGHQNTVFAYIGFPENAAPEAPVPGMVLVHGGGGHAYAEWVRDWVDRGFAAISFDGFGQAYIGENGTYEASLDFWKPDPEVRYPNDGFASVNKPFAEEGFTYYVADVFLAHNVLRADERVNNAQIGLSGISWGGIAASVAVCYDARFAFAAPVYGSGFMHATKTVWGEYFRKSDVSYVWDAGFLLGAANLPVRFFNSDCDPFFDVGAITASAAAAPLGSLTLLPGFTHGQIEGSSIPELTRFAEEQAGRGKKNIEISGLYADGDGAALAFSLPEDVKAAGVFVYYKTEDLIYEDKYLREAWKREKGETANGMARVRIPENAYLFYFSVEGANTDGQTLHATTGVYTRETWDAAECE